MQVWIQILRNQILWFFPKSSISPSPPSLNENESSLEKSILKIKTMNFIEFIVITTFIYYVRNHILQKLLLIPFSTIKKFKIFFYVVRKHVAREKVWCHQRKKLLLNDYHFEYLKQHWCLKVSCLQIINAFRLPNKFYWYWFYSESWDKSQINRCIE